MASEARVRVSRKDRRMSATESKKRTDDKILPGSDDLADSLKKNGSNPELNASHPQAESSTPSPPQLPSLSLVEVSSIPGLIYCPNFVSKEEEIALLTAIDAGEWDTTLKRRVQHFGLRYDYNAKSVVRSVPIEPLPSFCTQTVSRMEELNVFPSSPDQCIINGTSSLPTRLSSK